MAVEHSLASYDFIENDSVYDNEGYEEDEEAGQLKDPTDISSKHMSRGDSSVDIAAIMKEAQGNKTKKAKTKVSTCLI